MTPERLERLVLRLEKRIASLTDYVKMLTERIDGAQDGLLQGSGTPSDKD